MPSINAPSAVTRESLCLAAWCRPVSGDPPRQVRTAAPGLRLCRGCRERLATQIGLLPRLYGELESALTSAVRHRAEKVRTSSTPGIPLNERAADARARIRGVLAAWSDLVVEERKVTAPARTVPSLAGFLLRHLDWLAGHDAAGEAAREIGELVRTGRGVARPDPVRRIRLGACVESACSGVLFARVRDSDLLLPSAIVCDADSAHSWPPSAWHIVRKRMGRQL